MYILPSLYISSPCCFVTEKSLPIIRCADILPTQRITFGSIISICFWSHSIQRSCSVFFGSLFSGGLHLSILAMYILVSLLRPTSSSISVRSLPLLPTNGLPCSSSSLPGASPITSTLAFSTPSPKTSLVLLPLSSHRVHFSHCSFNSCNVISITK